jgi:type I restriction enzyme, S subunit
VSQSIVKINDVCEFVRGLTYSKSDEVEHSNNAVLRATNIDLNSNRLNLSEIRYIADSVNVKADKKVRVNDILICTASGSKSHLGKVALIEEKIDMAFGGFMGVLRAKPNINPKYLFAFFKSEIFLKHVFNTGDGANINNLKFSQFEDLEIVLPSLPIQQKIVNKLDAIFAEIEKATAAAAANAKNAKALFQSYLKQVFENDGSGWNLTFLNQISENLDSKRIPITKGIREEGEIPYYGASGIVDYVKDFIFDGDILLVSEDGANLLARTYPIAFSVSGKCWVNNHAHVVKFPNRISQKFVEFYLNSISLQPFVSGMAQPKLNQAMLNKIPIPFPSLEEQAKFVILFESINESSDMSYKAYIRKIEELSKFKNSILKQAFNGELVKE